MGRNLVLNLMDHGRTVAVFNRTAQRTRSFAEGEANGRPLLAFYDLESFVASLERPRSILLMIKAGEPVDDQIAALVPLLDPGDVIIDGGNSHFPDTIRRCEYVESKGKLYIGTGVSGGEEGALIGPSIMPGGSAAAWQEVRPVFEAIAAKVDGGTPCCTWVGADGAGHFVKMVHNGIEYGDMQLICETYQVMKELRGMSAAEIDRKSGV